MRRFLLQIAVFSVLVLGSVYVVFTRASGYHDYFYLRFTSPQQQNLILGTSKAAQGMQPAEFEKILQQPFYNYAFTIAHSPFGPTYLNSIQKKIDPETKNGIFVITLDPWSISSKGTDPDNPEQFGEQQLALGNTPFVNMDPNPIYLINNFSRRFKMLRTHKNPVLLQDDGWLDITLNMDSVKVANRIKIKTKEYQERHLPTFKPSQTRLSYLLKTMDFLHQYGEVYLVRLPVHPQILAIENAYMDDFDMKISAAIQRSEGYLDFSDRVLEFQYTDGLHLYKDAGKAVSEETARWIQSQQTTHPQ